MPGEYCLAERAAGQVWLCNPKNPKTKVLGKAEFLNPGYSMKDRIVANIFNKAEEDGTLKQGERPLDSNSLN